MFLASLRELEDKVASSEEYDMLSLSRLLRLLLNDGSPLVHQVNRGRGVDVTFRCGASTLNMFPASVRPDYWSRQDGLDPESAPPGWPVIEVSLSGFLSELVALHAGQEISVLDIIKYETHVEGGVHAGEPRGPEATALHDVAKRLQVGGFRPSLRQLRSIGRVTLRAVAALRDRVSEESRAQ